MLPGPAVQYSDMPRTCRLRAISRLGLALLAVLVLGAGIARAGSGTIAQQATATATGGQFTRVGLAPLRDDGKLRDGAAELLAIWQAQLEQEFPEVEFVPVDPEALDLPDGPLLLDEAIDLGAHYGVQALLTGVFGGVEVVGGTWPNAGSSFPSAKGAMSWRLVESRKGLLVADGSVDFRRPKAYSSRTKDSAQLARRVMQDLAREATAQLGGTGALAGTQREQEAQDE